MKILYIANHNAGGNEDEAAIAYALRQLGHEVMVLRESKGRRATVLDSEMVLFHKWCEPEVLRALQGRMKRVFWYFDLVDFPDRTLEERNKDRIGWMSVIVPNVDVGFCTDGDWVLKHNKMMTEAGHPAKLVWLTQGADGRKVPESIYIQYDKGTKCETCDGKWGHTKILMTGIRNGGKIRASFVDWMRANYKKEFRHIQRGIHGDSLSDLIRDTEIVVAPDGPVSDNYWSNRVYLTLGYGGFLLHPYCERLTEHYEDGKEIVYYKNREQLKHYINYYTYAAPDEKLKIARAGHERTRKDHMYLTRCKKLIEIVLERMP